MTFCCDLALLLIQKANLFRVCINKARDSALNRIKSALAEVTGCHKRNGTVTFTAQHFSKHIYLLRHGLLSNLLTRL